jgi:uncharacterized membrane protein
MAESRNDLRRAALQAAGGVLLLAGCGSGSKPDTPPSSRSPAAATPESPSGAVGASSPVSPASSKPAPHPCRIQGALPLDLPAVQALGTEPFWSAAVDGRCVTWSTPEDPAGTRLWTTYEQTGGADRWIGALKGVRFELSIRKGQPCSDGMSDTVYSLVAQVRLGQEVLQGCARPAAQKAGPVPASGNPAGR